MSVSIAFSTYLPGSPVLKSPPLQVPLTELPQRERGTPTSRAPFTHLSKTLVNETPSRFSAVPLWMEMPVSRAFST